nr:MAG TPA: hypothetical protein [Caudoviricetes sp.]
MLFFTHLPIPPTYLKPTSIISHFSTLRNEKDTRVARCPLSVLLGCGGTNHMSFVFSSCPV